MQRRKLLKHIGATGAVAVSGAVATSASGGGTDDQVYFVEETDDGRFVRPAAPSDGVGTATHGDGDCVINCCISGDCDCPSGCHCLDPSC